MEQNYKNHVQSKLICMYGIITDTPNESTDSYIAYNDLSSDEYEPVSTAHYQATNANHKITELDNNKCDMFHDNIENQMNAPTQDIINDEVSQYINICNVYNLIRLKIC